MEELPQKEAGERFHGEVNKVLGLLDDYVSLLSVGEHAEERSACLENIVCQYREAVETGRETNVANPEKKMFFRFRNHLLEQPDMSPLNRGIIKRDMGDVLRKVGEEEVIDFSYIGRIGELREVEVIVMALNCLAIALDAVRERSFLFSDQMKEVLNQGLKNVIYMRDLYYKKSGNAGLKVDLKMLLSTAEELKTLTRNDEFWGAFDALLAAQSQMGYPGIRLGRQTISDRRQMTEFLESNVNLLNRLVLENYPVEKRGKGN